MDPEGGRLLTIREAADALGVSVETVRRWAASGRIRAERTAGGHRRFDPAEVGRLKGDTASRLRPIPLPGGPLPGLGDLLEREGTRLLGAAGARLYGNGGRGWFKEERTALTDWVSAVAKAASGGQWAAAATATRSMLELAQLQGASLLERHGFLETFGGLALRELAAGGTGGEELSEARRGFAALRQRLLHEADSAAAASPSAPAGALGEKLADLLALPDLESVAVYEADTETLGLRLRAFAGAPGTDASPDERASFGSGPIGRAALSRRAALDRDAAGRPLAVAPMLAGGDLAGVVVLGLRRARPIGERELHLLEALGASLAKAIGGSSAGGERLPRAVEAFRRGWTTPGRSHAAV